MTRDTAVVIGAGVGGLAAAIDLAAAGLSVTLLERAPAPGGKLREVSVAGQAMDAGPTVFTLRDVFEQLFADAGFSLDALLALRPAERLARHAWDSPETLDLHADRDRSVAAIGAFAGAAEARRYVAFCNRARRIHDALDATFMRDARPSPAALVRRAGLRGLGGLLRIAPFTTLWQALGEHFHDPRLRQLFARYATYCGSSPFAAPATLMLIAHVEQQGVWLVDGGMHRLAQVMADIAGRLGATCRYDSHVTAIEAGRGRVSAVRLADGTRVTADIIVCNADIGALADGRLGAAARVLPPVPRERRSQSALTFNLLARTQGFALLRHNVFFGGDYAREFDDVFEHRRLPRDPTVYVCAQDRDGAQSPSGDERLLCLVNAPPDGDLHPLDPGAPERCLEEMMLRFARCGLQVEPSAPPTITTPADFDALFPGTGGALYGQVSHGWRASFERPGSRTRLPGLYLAGGSVHPGAGVPMATLSGRLAAAAVLADLRSPRRSGRTATAGGTSTR